MGKERKKYYLTEKQKVNINRISVVCGGISEGLNFDEIQIRLNNLPDKNRKAKGECSVFNVIRVVNSLPSEKISILEIKKTEDFSFEDVVQKHDLEITCTNELIGLIGVQVKSSIYGVLDFYKSFHQDYEKAKEIVTKEKIIILNGQLPDEIIKQNFLEQFKKIEQYCQTN